MRRFVVGALLAIAAALPLLLFPFPAQAQEGTKPKVIVLGFDGVDARFTEQWMDEGHLPNMARLREEGTFRHLRPTIPAQTPVSWSTFATGIDPGRTGIFDFLRRDPETYLPVFAAFDEGTEPFLLGDWNRWAGGLALALVVFGLSLLALKLARVQTAASVILALLLAMAAGHVARLFIEKNIPTKRPVVVNRQQGIPMWEVLGDAGISAKVVHVPVTFPAKPYPKGHLLAGLGVPDISARVGKPFYFTSELDFNRGRSNEFSIEVVQLIDNRGEIPTKIQGPPNKLFDDPPYIDIPMTVTVAEDRESIEIEVSGQSLTMRAGEWSDWVDFEFPFSSVVSIHGISRFHLLSIRPEIRLYLSPINFDPRDLPPGFNVSAPYNWAPELAEKYGRFKTIGWAIDTWAISEGFADEQMFWDDMEWTVEKYREMFNDFLDGQSDFLLQCFEFPDRVAHVFFRLHDSGHPAHDPELAAQWDGAILESYKLMDEIVGEAMAAAERRNAALIVMSDHGFSTWHRSVNYNTWLAENGYLGLRTGVEAKELDLEVLFDHGEFWENVDWSETRAYALGLGNIYINLAGREAQGIVQPGEEYEALKRELKEKLEAMVDPDTGRRPVSRVFLREEAYRAFDPNVIPDLIVANSEGYRVSWQTSLGGVQKNIFEDNVNVWSGDHCSLDPEIVKGIFFYNRKLETSREPYIADIYPTILGLYGVAPPYELDGEELR
jgi:predicted AlkP superfamily phosphohydrolase/phosphomutase